MRSTLAGLALLGLTLLVGVSAKPGDTDLPTVPACRLDQRMAEVSRPYDVDAHRLTPLPAFHRPHGSSSVSPSRGFEVTLRIDEAGRVECADVDRSNQDDPKQSAERRPLMAAIGGLRYQPFLYGGRAATAIVTERIPDIEDPERFVAMPRAPLSDVHFTLSRGGCLGPCPIYRVEVSGNGQVVYSSDGTADLNHADVVGTHRYTIAPEALARLVDSVRRYDLWSLEGPFVDPTTYEGPTYEVTLQFGKQTHVIVDNGGEGVGMPPAVTAFERELDELSRAAEFVRLSRFAVETMDGEGYDFGSQDAGAMLRRAAFNHLGHDDAAMTMLLQRGAPVDVEPPGSDDPSNSYGRSALDGALSFQRATLIDPLVERGALRTTGVLSQRKLDRAFISAIRGGSVELVRKIWGIAGGDIHPALSFTIGYRVEDRQEFPVTEAIEPEFKFRQPWQFREINAFLLSVGSKPAEQPIDDSAACR